MEIEFGLNTNEIILGSHRKSARAESLHRCYVTCAFHPCQPLLLPLILCYGHFSRLGNLTVVSWNHSSAHIWWKKETRITTTLAVIQGIVPFKSLGHT